MTTFDSKQTSFLRLGSSVGLAWVASQTTSTLTDHRPSFTTRTYLNFQPAMVCQLKYMHLHVGMCREWCVVVPCGLVQAVRQLHLTQCNVHPALFPRN